MEVSYGTMFSWCTRVSLSICSQEAPELIYYQCVNVYMYIYLYKKISYTHTLNESQYSTLKSYKKSLWYCKGLKVAAKIKARVESEIDRDWSQYVK